MTLIFLLIVAMILATLESAICFTSSARIRGGARASAMSSFGNYNRELYEEYGLLGYGGFDGKNQGTLQRDLFENLQMNLQNCPDNSTYDYMNIYPVKNLNLAVKKCSAVTEKDMFLKQIKEYLLTNGLANVLEKGRDEKYDLQKNKGEFGEGLDKASDYEHGKYKKKSKEESQDNSQKESFQETDSTEEQDSSRESVKDCAGGNPLKSFCSLMEKGMLSMVCDSTELSEETIPEVYSEPGVINIDRGTKKSAADWFKKIGDVKYGQEHEKEEKAQSVVLSKAELLAYANLVLGCYVTDKKKGYSYGLEYLISGNEEEQSNLCGIVNRLFIIRLAINYLYVSKDAVIMEKSKATALAITSLFLSPELEESVAQLILLILAAQESFVDIAALLDGRQVPISKNTQNFQMKYEEICAGSPTLFRQKAKKFQKSNQGFEGNGLDYKSYLMGFLMFVDSDTIRKRIYDLIQFDLRQRFNQTFVLGECIGEVNYEVDYQIPMLWSGITGFTGEIHRREEGFYSMEP